MSGSDRRGQGPALKASVLRGQGRARTVALPGRGLGALLGRFSPFQWAVRGCFLGWRGNVFGGVLFRFFLRISGGLYN